MFKKKRTKAKRKHSKGNRRGKYRSDLEFDMAKDLMDRGIRFEYESEKIPYVSKHVYTNDFRLKNGIIIEAKGWLKQEDRRKMLEVKKQHPELDIRFVFEKASNKIRKGSKTTYAMWCEKNNFKYSEKTVPDEWLEE